MPPMIRCMAKSVQQNGVYVIGMKYTLYCSVAILYNIRQYTVYVILMIASIANPIFV